MNKKAISEHQRKVKTINNLYFEILLVLLNVEFTFSVGNFAIDFAFELRD
jgi:hypothetical protein